MAIKQLSVNKGKTQFIFFKKKIAVAGEKEEKKQMRTQ